MPSQRDAVEEEDEEEAPPTEVLQAAALRRMIQRLIQVPQLVKNVIAECAADSEPLALELKSAGMEAQRTAEVGTDTDDLPGVGEQSVSPASSQVNEQLPRHAPPSPLTSPHLTSPHLTSPHITSPHITSHHLTSPHLT